MTDSDGAFKSFTDIRREIGPGRSIVFVSGNFNVVHPGHLRLLKFASEAGDVVVVGVTPDSAKDVTVPARMRLESLRAHSHIHYALVMSEPVTDVIASLRPDVVVKGKEFESRFNPEKAVIESYGGKLLFSSGEVRFSSLELLRLEYLETTLSTIKKPMELPERRGFSVSGLKALLGKFRGVRMLVIGDLIIDSYIDCEALGMSQEEPTIVLSPIETRTFVGGAGIVALHARGLGAQVNFVTIVGDDHRAEYARERLAKHDVHAVTIVDPSRPTTLKTRYRAAGKSLLRVNELRQHAAEQALIEKTLAEVERLLPETDLLLFSDFNYGCLPQILVDAIIERAASRGIMMAADSQASSQLADISRYRDMTLITPTEREARLAMGDFESGLVAVAEALQSKSRCKHLFVTLGSEGLLVLGDDEGTVRTDRLPAFNTAPKDVAGAGDCLFTAATLALCCGASIWESAYLGSLAAAVQTSRVGNLPLTVDEIIAEIDYTPTG